MQTNLAILTLTVIASATVSANRFVTQAGALPAAGGLPFGVTRTDGISGDPIPVDVLGTALVQAGGTITKDAPLMVTVEGKVIAHDLDGDKHAVARAMSDAVDGEVFEVLLLPSAGLLVTAT
ncbi:MAG: capsid cement protein [Burkholderiales bacterium]